MTSFSPNKVHSSQASPAEPVYFRYHIPEDVDSVLIHVDSNSTTCMYVSVQKINVSFSSLLLSLKNFK